MLKHGRGGYACSNSHAPHLKAIFAGCYSWNKYDGFLRGGMLANWGTGPQSAPASAGLIAIPVDEDNDGSMLKEAIRQHQQEVKLLDIWKGMPYRDSWSDIVSSRFWLEGSVSTYQWQIERTGVGIYSYGGWYDDFRREALIASANLHNLSKVLIGPWGHCETIGLDIITESLRFFDYWLKGIDNGIMKEPSLCYYTEGATEGKEWHFASQWPLPNEKATKYYLQAGGALTTNAPKEKMGADLYTVNYDVNCPNPVGLSQTCVLDSKGITYTSPVLTDDMELTGHPI